MDILGGYYAPLEKMSLSRSVTIIWTRFKVGGLHPDLKHSWPQKKEPRMPSLIRLVQKEFLSASDWNILVTCRAFETGRKIAVKAGVVLTGNDYSHDSNRGCFNVQRTAFKYAPECQVRLGQLLLFCNPSSIMCMKWIRVARRW